jgi:N6-adenosine-specific RNA methylase IME4
MGVRQEFSVILADPAWRYADRSKHRGGAERHYPTMTVADIAALPVADIAAPNAALFLWGTWPMMQEALDVIRAWGFRYTTGGFVWLKTTRNGKHAIGMGHYTRANTEFCLLAVRGRMPVANRGVRQVIEAPRMAHSAKPAETYDRIEALYPQGHRAELFARGTRPGWESFGHGIDGRCLSQSLVGGKR